VGRELAGVLSLAELSDELVNLRLGLSSAGRVEVIDEQFAGEMVGFMLKGATEEVFGLDLDGVPFQIESPRADLLRSLHFTEKAREAQTSFLVFNGGMPFHNLRIDEDLLLVFLGRVGSQVQNKESKRQRHLIGRQTNSLTFIH